MIAKSETIQFAAETPIRGYRSSAPFKLLVVDDDDDVHVVTKQALRPYYTAQTAPTFLHAYNSIDAHQLLAANRDIAVILLDIVMETADAGLTLINTIRSDLQLSRTQIILRTGQPGRAREDAVVAEYAINGYLSKSTLTPASLFSAITTAHRAYSLLCKEALMSAALEALLSTTVEHVGDQSLDGFTLDSMAHLAAMFETPSAGLVLRRSQPDQPMTVTTTTPEFSSLSGLCLESIGDQALRQRIENCLQTRESIIDNQAATLFLPGTRSAASVMHVPLETNSGQRSPVDRHLLDLMVTTYGAVSDKLGR